MTEKENKKERKSVAERKVKPRTKKSEVTSAARRKSGMEEDEVPAPRKNVNIWRAIRDGRSLSLTFFKRNGWLILLVVVAVIWLISQRYSNQSRMEEIKALEKNLRRSESNFLNAKSSYMSLIRESKMKELLEKNNLEISYQEQPAYILPSQ